MTLHPAAPADLNALIDAYAHSIQAILDLGAGLREGEAELPTDCPGWSVLDQIRHVASLEAMILGEPVPDVDVSGKEHVRGDFGVVIEKLIEPRRAQSVAQVLEDLEGTFAQRMAQLREPDLTLESPIQGLFGPTTVGEMLAMRLFDIWVHEQDIREALGRPGNLDSGGAANAVARTFSVFPKVVAKTAGIEPGNAVILDLTGPVTGRVGVRVEDIEGTPRGIPLFSGESDEEPHEVRTTTIALSTQAAMRRAAGRRSTDDTHASITGDEQIARRVLDALAITP